ncbi:MAG: phosphoribosylformylglycinamidine synthase subunit PurS, partial [Phycisphaerales bacterium]|nr:phosphoribosylformylglycinamidine synthase subunit PurS [Phycisphaerales bacterium]
VGSAPSPGALAEVHPLPGVMDPPAQTVRDAIEELVGVACRVSTGWRYDLVGVDADQARAIAERLLANPVVSGVHDEPFHPDRLPTGHAYSFSLRHIPIRDLDDAALEKLSRDAHLFLDLHEMRAIRDEYRTLEREPTDIELETLAQTWSEHCVHKTLKATINYTSNDPSDPVKRPGRPGHEAHPDGSVIIRNLLKSTVAAATHELIAEGVDWTLSVFVDNAGIIKFDEHNAVCVKVETHNHPSAIEPYGGAATGIGGCIRDIMGTGLAAKPIANTDVFCVAMPDSKPQDVPDGCIHPKRTLERVIDGVRDYGNRMGIPTVNGCVDFDARYVGNPLVFCGS